MYFSECDGCGKRSEMETPTSATRLVAGGLTSLQPIMVRIGTHEVVGHACPGPGCVATAGAKVMQRALDAAAAGHA